MERAHRDDLGCETAMMPVVPAPALVGCRCYQLSGRANKTVDFVNAGVSYPATAQGLGPSFGRSREQFQQRVGTCCPRMPFDSIIDVG